MDQCVKLGKLIKSNSFHQFKAHLTHWGPKLTPANLVYLIFQILHYQSTKSKQYLDLFDSFHTEINYFYKFKNRYEQLVGKTPLMAACQLSNFQAVSSLLQHKNIKVNLADQKGENCVFYAIRNDSQEECYQILRLILTPDLANSTNFQGESVLFQALQKKSLRIVELLLKKNSDPNFKCNKTGNTVLHKALLNSSLAKDKKKDLILLLLNNQADPKIENKEAKNCFDIAKEVNLQFDWLIELQKQNQQPIQQVIVCHQQINSVTKQDENSMYLNESLSVSSQTEQEQFTIDKLSAEIQLFSRECQTKYYESWKDVQYIYQKLQEIGNSLYLNIDIIGSYATGLWTQYSDIDIVFTNLDSSYIHIEQMLEKIYSQLKFWQKQLGIKEIYLNRNNIGNSFPNIKMDLVSKLNNRKIDITIFQRKNNGQKYVNYIKQQLQRCQLIKPVFFAIHKLLLSFNLNNPAKNGIKTYALFLMIVISYQNIKSMTLGQLFINTIYYFAYCFNYEQLSNGQSKMNIYDPLNPSNNVGGRKTDVNRLREMFRTVDYGLRLAEGKNILQYLFSLHNIFQK